MASNPVEILDCKVRVRKYVLISSPSRWKQKVERVVVQSPMLEITNSAVEVPVKRYNGEEQNSVCFIPKHDIEKDISIYDYAKVTTTESWVDAQGVALFDSTLEDNLKYRRGDRFWICIGTNTGFKSVVPVINLSSQIFEKGDVRIDQVCWFPKIQGPNGELWTLGGETRHLKLSGRKNYSYLSWAICQLLDSSPPTTEILPMPAKDVEMKARLQLSIADARSLFQKRLRYMEAITADGAIQTGGNKSQSLCLPTPPASPDQDLLRFRHHLKKVPVVAKGQCHSLPRPWRGIFELSRRTNGKYVLRNSLIHPQQPPQSPVERWLPSVASMDGYSEDEDSEMDENSSTCCHAQETSHVQAHPRDETLSSRDIPDLDNPDLYSCDLHNLDGPGVCGAADFLEICRKEEKTLLTSKKDKDEDLDHHDNDADDYYNAKSMHEVWEAKKRTENPRFTALCSIKDPHCPYTILSTRLHYHCPEQKCKLSKTIFPADASPSASSAPEPEKPLDEYDPNHIHCVSRLGPFPDSAGECHLQNSLYKYPDHKCCYWKDEYLHEMTSRGKREYEKRKTEEAKRKHMQIRDRTGDIAVRLGQGQTVGIRDCERLGGLGEAGRGLLGELEDGAWDDEVEKMGEEIGGMRDELQAMDDGSDDNFGF